MGHISHLTRRGAVYYARIDVPEDLVSLLKTQTRKLSLKTKDEAEAKRRLWPVITEWQREFDDLRSRRILVDLDKQHAVWGQYTGVLERDELARSQLPGEAEVDAATDALRARIDRGEIKSSDPRQRPRRARTFRLFILHTSQPVFTPEAHSPHHDPAAHRQTQ